MPNKVGEPPKLESGGPAAEATPGDGASQPEKATEDFHVKTEPGASLERLLLQVKLQRHRLLGPFLAAEVPGDAEPMEPRVKKTTQGISGTRGGERRKN